MGFVCTRPSRISARLGLLRSLSSDTGLPVGFHGTFIDTRDIVFDVSQSRSLFRRSALHRSDTSFYGPYRLPNVFLGGATGT
jgi:hypothetical protein